MRFWLDSSEKPEYLVDNVGRRKTNFHPISLHISWSLRLNRKAAGRWVTRVDRHMSMTPAPAWLHWFVWINISIVYPCLRLSCVHGSNKAEAKAEASNERFSIFLAHAFICSTEGKESNFYIAYYYFLWIFDFPFHPLFVTVWVIHRLASTTFITFSFCEREKKESFPIADVTAKANDK